MSKNINVYCKDTGAGSTRYGTHFSVHGRENVTIWGFSCIPMDEKKAFNRFLNERRAPPSFG
jgi:hypothetical protein